MRKAPPVRRSRGLRLPKKSGDPPKAQIMHPFVFCPELSSGETLELLYFIYGLAKPFRHFDERIALLSSIENVWAGRYPQADLLGPM